MSETFGTQKAQSEAQTSSQPTQRITIRNVAADAGVSISAVSKVLRNAYGVSSSLRAKVNTSIEKLGYRPSAAARGMRGQSYTLGVLLTDLRNVFFAEIMEGINDTLSATSYQPLLGVSQLRAKVERSLIDAMIDRQMDGLIFVAPRMSLSEIEDVAKRIPTVVVGLHPEDANLFDTVNNDDLLGAEKVVDYLADQGQKRITFFTLTEPDDEDNTVMVNREHGYINAMKRRGLESEINIVRSSHKDVVQAAGDILDSNPRPDAIFCWGDFWGFRTISAATERGLKVPNDVRVVGYDNSIFCELNQNSLTSVDQYGRDLGMQAAKLLIERIEGRREAEHFIVEPKLVLRNSTAAMTKLPSNETE